ncbi:MULTISPECIES: hypothetical protein [unclassified Microbacterium]|uniref:hypothetical protein n=1 Tax=unclassified Microbacterium TaxID=2609290 RepID=UPI00301A4CF0
MRQANLEHLTELMPALQTGSLTRSDTVSLFSLIRDHADHGSAIRDIGDAVVHDNRNEGMSFDLLNDFADQIVAAIDGGGEFRVKVLYPIRRVIRELGEFCAAHGISLVPLSADATEALTGNIATMLDGTKVKMRNPSVESAELRGGDEPTYSFQFARKSTAVVHMPALAGFAGPLFRSDKGTAFGPAATR